MTCLGKSSLPVLLLLALGTWTQTAKADTISYTGNLRDDANVTDCGFGCVLGPLDTDWDYAQYASVVRTFTVAAPSMMQATSFSYGGGMNGAGTTILEGGLEPYLSLFDSSGNFLASTYFGTTCPAGAATNTLSGQCFDVQLDGGLLGPGSYEIALTAYFNLSYAENLGGGTLADGFTGLGNLADGEDLHYAFDVVLTPAVSSVPEPATVGLVMPVAGFLLFQLRRRQPRTGNPGC